ncbi:MAG TPA: hypothetical protein EYQ83_21780 [Acidobacteria bacterium]|nr:hypothetical protein [Acidobacteriota bacterium]
MDPKCGGNATVLALTALVGCLTVLATGVAPALAQSRPDLSRAGRRGTASDTPTPSATRLVDGLVAGQAALAVAVMRPALRAMLVGVVVGLFGAARRCRD